MVRLPRALGPVLGGLLALAASSPMAALAQQQPPVAPAPIAGSFALAGAAAKVEGTLAAAPVSGTVKALDLVLHRTGDPAPLTAFEPDPAREMHIVAVSEDFSRFAAAHIDHVPSDGHVRTTFVFPAAGLYHVFAAFTPVGLGLQVLRFDLPVETAGAERAPSRLRPSELEAAAGPYTVRFARLDAPSGTSSRLSFGIYKGEALATDLKPYLGAPAYLVLIDPASLQYLPVEAVVPEAPGPTPSPPPSGAAGAAPETPASPAALEAELRLSKPGAYGLWLEFRGGKTLYTVAFTLEAR